MDRDMVRQFLTLWFQNCPEGQYLEIRPLHKRPPARPLPQAWVQQQGDAERAVDLALARVERCVANGDDVYVGALPRLRESGTQDAVGARLWIWGDVDYGTVGHKTPALYADRDAALEGIRSCGIQPTAIVDTGGGFHAWWYLTRVPSDASWQDAIKRLAQAIKADMNALDPPRILRVPGTFNFKNEPPREVRLVEMSGRLVSVGDFLRLPAYVKPEAPPRTKTTASSSSAMPGQRPFDRANDEPVAEVLDWLGVRLHREGSRIYCACPVHGGTNESQMVVGGDSNVATCFGDCGGKHYTPVDLTAAVQRCTARQAVDMMANRFGFDGFSKRARGSTKSTTAEADTASVSPQAQATATSSDGSTQWETRFVRNKDGSIKTTLGNVILVLENAPRYAGKLRWNEMALCPELDGELFSDPKVVRLREAIEREYRMMPTDSMVRDALCAATERHSYHPVQEYLGQLQWDGQARISLVARDILGAKDEALASRLLRAWFISAVARGMQPGSKVDTALVLVGPQGFYKSSFFRILGSPFFVDTAIDLGNKDAYMQLAKAWVYEWPEIDVIMSQKHAGQIKGFLTSQHDTFRPPFGRGVVDHPRSCVLVGTTNESTFLTDATGSRRFWVIRVDRAVNIARLAEWRDQLWAEATTAYKAGERWWLDSVEEAVREDVAEDYCVEDAWQEPIAAYAALRGAADITISGVMGALNLDTAHQHAGTMNRIGRVLHRLGYENKRKRDPRSGGKRKISVWQKVSLDT